MTLDKRTREQMLAHCGQLHEDDGVDPRDYFKPDPQRDKQNRKAQQLCQQVAETLGLVLAGEFGDQRLHNLQVVSVQPAPNTSQLLVTVQTDPPSDAAYRQEIMNCLAAVSGRLRSEVASAINRKRTPRLLFNVIGRHEGQNEQQPREHLA